MKIINLFAGPGVGKSTIAAGLFYELKCQGNNVELVTEYAKDMVYESRPNILSDQIYILAKQNRRLARLYDHNIDYVITDSPLPLGLIYMPENYFGNFEPLLLEVFNSYQNINIMLKRNEDFIYNPQGRNQKELTDAQEIDLKLKNFLNGKIQYSEVEINADTIENILKLV